MTPQQFTIESTNLMNPQSIAAAGEIQITTLMKYSSDERFYPIDSFLGDSNFKATTGSVADVETESKTGNFATYADNQIFKVTFVPAHTVFMGGYLKVKYPDFFSMSSESSAVSQFRLLDTEGQGFGVIYVVSMEE